MRTETLPLSSCNRLSGLQVHVPGQPRLGLRNSHHLNAAQSDSTLAVKAKANPLSIFGKILILISTTAGNA